MRNLSSGNKMRFTVFTVIVLVIIVIIVQAVIIGLRNVKEKYQVSKNACIYDYNYNYIELESGAQIQKKWNNNYYLKEDETKKEYKLGKYSVSYDTSRRNLDLFGNFYQVLKGGDVNKLTEHNSINAMQESKFYKIDDRKYLIVSRDIKNDTGSLSTQNYLIVILDRLGNALLLNDKINAKTIKEMIISTEEFDFDVANERLFFGEDDINLKKIIGSSNQYIKTEKEETKEQNTIEDETKDENVVEETKTATQPSETATTTATTNNATEEVINSEKTTVIENNKDDENKKTEEINKTDDNKIDNNAEDKNENKIDNKTEDKDENKTQNQESTNTVNNQVDNSQNKDTTKEETSKNSEESKKNNEEKEDTSWVDNLNAWINSVASGFKSLYNGSKNKKEDTTLNRSIALNNLSAGTTYIDVSYTISDPENKYNVVYITVSSSTEVKNISLSKEDTSYRVTELKPNTDYTVEMGYKIIYSSAETEETIEDTMNIRTKTPNESLKITKVTTSKIYYTLKLDSDFIYDEGCAIVVYLNDDLQYQTIELNESNLSKATASGYTGSFDIPVEYKAKGSSVKICLENTKLDGVTVDSNLTSKIVNY